MDILIVDDSKDSRELLKAFLKKAGYTDITSAASAQEAFDALGMGAEHRHTIPFKAILMDVVMPGMNGIEACRAIKQDPHLADIPVIMVTAVGGSQEHLNEAFEAGATDYITKPVKSVELLARVRSALRLHGEMERRKTHEKELTETLAQLQSAQDQLLRSKKLVSMGILSAGVAHEILNPLNIISTTAQLLMMEEPRGPIHEKIQVIFGQIQRATKIINSLSRFAGQNRMEMESVHLSSCFERAAASMEQDIKDGNLTIERHFDSSVPPVKGDKHQLERVFSIFISNALDATGARGKGTIRVETRPVENSVEFKFYDDGPGIPADVIEKVFDPFFTTKDPGMGVGLGLSIAHRIIGDHGGTLSVESEPGKTCFTIFLPQEGCPPVALDKLE